MANKILFVDDEPDFKEMFETAGNLECVTVTVLNKATTAVDYLATIKYDVDVIILDLSIPEFDGLSLCKRIRLNEVNHKNTPTMLAFYTGLNEYNDIIVNTARENKVRKIFPKPYPVQQLIAEVKNWQVQEFDYPLSPVTEYVETRGIEI